MRNLKAKVSDCNSFASNVGEKFQPVFKSSILPDGSVSLRQVDKLDIQAHLNAQREFTDMSFILARLGIGDTSVLNAKNGMYGDFTKMPKTMAEFMQLAIDGQNTFNHLPLDLRAKYDYNYTKWLSEVGTDSWLSNMKDFIPGLEESVSPEAVLDQVDKILDIKEVSVVEP